MYSTKIDELQHMLALNMQLEARIRIVEDRERNLLEEMANEQQEAAARSAKLEADLVISEKKCADQAEVNKESWFLSLKCRYTNMRLKRYIPCSITFILRIILFLTSNYSACRN